MDNQFTEWSPSAIISAVMVLSGLFGAGVAWLANHGLAKLMEWRKFRLEEKERLSKLQPTPAKFSTEQLYEDDELGTGYKIMMYQQDKRIRDLEVLNSDSNAKWLKCVQDHANADARANHLQNQLDDQKRENEKLGREVSRLHRVVQALQSKRGVEEGDQDSERPKPS